jgi:hypothetical protein
MLQMLEHPGRLRGWESAAAPPAARAYNGLPSSATLKYADVAAHPAFAWSRSCLMRQCQQGWQTGSVTILLHGKATRSF